MEYEGFPQKRPSLSAWAGKLASQDTLYLTALFSSKILSLPEIILFIVLMYIICNSLPPFAPGPRFIFHDLSCSLRDLFLGQWTE